MQKSVWGPATWKVIHCLSFKSNKNIKTNELNDLKNIISQIMANLPCPYCASHAISYLSSTNFKSIKNINDLITYLFNFHNNVNMRLNKPTITLDEHNKIYTEMNLVNTMQNFIDIYKKNTNSVTMMLYNFHRKQMVYDVYVFVQNHKPLYGL